MRMKQTGTKSPIFEQDRESHGTVYSSSGRGDS